MTTNESGKWSDWKEDVDDGMVFKYVTGNSKSGLPLLAESQHGHSHWPVSSDQILGFTEGDPPREGHRISPGSNEIMQPNTPDAPIDRRWVQVHTMGEIDNIYDLGFWDNLHHIFGFPIGGKKHSA